MICCPAFQHLTSPFSVLSSGKLKPKIRDFPIDSVSLCSSMKKVKEGVPLGQIKSPTIIAPDNKEIPDTLRDI